MRGTSSPPTSTSVRAPARGEPTVVVRFADGPEGEQLLVDLGRALARRAARRFLVDPAPSASADATPDDG